MYCIRRPVMSIRDLTWEILDLQVLIHITSKTAFVTVKSPLDVGKYSYSLISTCICHKRKLNSNKCFKFLLNKWLIVCRLLEYLPSLPQDAVQMYREIMDIFHSVSAKMANRKRRYTARCVHVFIISVFYTLTN
jgi:hypothetical protein